jgi:hypothetical protein
LYLSVNQRDLEEGEVDMFTSSVSAIYRFSLHHNAAALMLLAMLETPLDTLEMLLHIVDTWREIYIALLVRLLSRCVKIGVAADGVAAYSTNIDVEVIEGRVNGFESGNNSNELSIERSINSIEFGINNIESAIEYRKLLFKDRSDSTK